ncbi:hypothetical protein P692DRAFT_201604791 [Suillus brevipes Sb2]|nr:hypothetical protein P692DRAFT_201604791 [Suillus brevipes Sb2]
MQRPSSVLQLHPSPLPLIQSSSHHRRRSKEDGLIVALGQSESFPAWLGLCSFQALIQLFISKHLRFNFCMFIHPSHVHMSYILAIALIEFLWLPYTCYTVRNDPQFSQHLNPCVLSATEAFEPTPHYPDTPPLLLLSSLCKFTLGGALNTLLSSCFARRHLG